MAKKEIGKAGVFLLDQLRQGVLVLHHGVRTLVSPVAPGVVDHSGPAVAHVVVRRHDETGVQKFGNHMEIPPGVLPEAVNQLDNAQGLGGGNINPPLNLVPLVEGLKADLVQHCCSSCSGRGKRPL